MRGNQTLGPDDPDCDVPMVSAPDIELWAYSPAVDDPDIWDRDKPLNDLRVELLPPKYIKFEMTEKTFMDRVTAGTDFSNEPYRDRWHFHAVMRDLRNRRITVILRRSRVLGDRAIGYRRAYLNRCRREGREIREAYQRKLWREQHLRPKP